MNACRRLCAAKARAAMRGPRGAQGARALPGARPRGLTQRVAGLVLPGADVQPGQQDGVVVASPVLPRQPGLPLAEAA